MRKYQSLGILLRRAPLFFISMPPLPLGYIHYSSINCLPRPQKHIISSRVSTKHITKPSTAFSNDRTVATASYKRPHLCPRRWHRQFRPRRPHHPRSPRIRHNFKRTKLLLLLPVIPWYPVPYLRISLQLNRHHSLRHQLHRLIIFHPVLPDTV